MIDKNAYMQLKLTVIFVLFCNLQIQANSLQKIWETDTLFAKPESAIYDSVNHCVYISNINGKYLAKDGNGFISKIDLKGNIIKLEWIKGFDNPQGMAISKRNLYIADIEKIIQVDIRSGKKVKEYNVTGAAFLNDVTSDNEGNIYISDCKKNKVFKLTNNEVTVWLNDTILKSPNGLLCQHKSLFLLNQNSGIVFKINRKDKSIIQFTEGIKNCDGITPDGEGGFFISGAWQGQIYHINSNGDKKLVLDLGNEKTITADITYIPKTKMLIIPTLYKTVLAYKWLNY